MSETETAEVGIDDVDLPVESNGETSDLNGGGETEKSGRKHGRSFIYLTLEDAEKAVKSIDGHEQRMGKLQFAQALKHPQPKGRFLQKLAALEAYQLVRVEPDTVFLTDLAVEMLYGPTEQVRLRARAKAFLSYDLFKETYVQCPKSQDHPMSYVDDYVRVTLKIVNEREMFLRRFLESAAYAGLLEGEPNPKAQVIRLRPAVIASANGGIAPEATTKSSENQWVIVAHDDIGAVLDSLGLTAYHDRCDVSQQAAGEISINMADGKITVEVRRPVRVAIKTSNMLSDVTDILKTLQSKGFKT